LKAASTLWRLYFRQIALQAEFWDIRVTVSSVVVSGFVARFVVMYFLHIFVYFSACFYMEAVG